MSELYQKWSEQKCQFHYVSASPWQLYPALRCFLEKYKFPLGTMNLRKFAWNLQFFNSADTYKIETISEIIDAYPLRKYICVGDSGELDPEIYSKLYQKYPQSIVHIFIRDVCKPPCLPTCEERYKKTFEDIPKERWTIFKDSKEIETDIKKLTSV
jgi:phosphatidate phosphatase APP1